MEISAAVKKSLICIVILGASCVRPTRGILGVPDFLELGLCQNATLHDGFDPIKYQGLWFDIMSVPNEYQHAKQCNSMNYTWTGDSMISIGKGITEDGKKVKQVSEILEELELREPPHPAYMTVLADGVPESPYEIVSTDYVTYSCVHSCLEYFGFKAEFFWVFSRTPTLAPEYIAKCYDTLTNMGVNPHKMEVVPQGEFCPYAKKLDNMLEQNRQVLLRLGLPDIGTYTPPSDPNPVVPPPPAPTVAQETRNEEPTGVQEEMVNTQLTKNNQSPLPDSEDETSLEGPEEGSSAAATLASNMMVHLFISATSVLLFGVVR